MYGYEINRWYDLQSKVQPIKNWNHEYLFDHNLNPNDTPKYYQRLFVLSYTVPFRYQAMTQFNEGMASIDNVFQTPIITEQSTKKILQTSYFFFTLTVKRTQINGGI